MADQPAKSPPSSAPLSVEDADRLAASFTPFWEDEDLPGQAQVAAQPPAAAPLHGFNKHTLLGLAPITVPEPTLPPAPLPPAPSVAIPSATTPGSSTVTPLMPALAAPRGTHHKTLLGFSPPAVPMPAAPSALAPVVVSPVAVQGALDVPGYAGKYAPKDGPATPPVVIASEAQSSPDAINPALSATRPSRARVAPGPVPARAAGAAVEVDDLYTPKKKAGPLLYAGAAALLLLLGAVLGIRALSADADSASTPIATTVVPAAAAPGSIAAAQATAAPSAEPRPLEAAPVVMPSSAPPPQIGSAAHVKAAKPKVQAAAPAARPAARPKTPVSPAGDASMPAPKAAATKSVIVRDSPF